MKHVADLIQKCPPGTPMEDYAGTIASQRQVIKRLFAKVIKAVKDAEDAARANAQQQETITNQREEINRLNGKWFPSWVKK